MDDVIHPLEEVHDLARELVMGVGDHPNTHGLVPPCIFVVATPADS
jgi:hypothetical protein